MDGAASHGIGQVLLHGAVGDAVLLEQCLDGSLRLGVLVLHIVLLYIIYFACGRKGGLPYIILQWN